MTLTYGRLPVKRLVVLTSLVVASCTFGGSDEDPSNGYEPVDAGAAIDAASVDAVAALDASPRNDSGPSQDSGGPTVDANVPQICTPATPVAVCDPVKNSGCLFSQCEIDSSATTPSGRCVLATLPLGATCSSDGFSTSCTAPNSCVNGTCQKPCYCDADCDMGTSCKGAAPGPAGPLKLCVAN